MHQSEIESAIARLEMRVEAIEAKLRELATCWPTSSQVHVEVTPTNIDEILAAIEKAAPTLKNALKEIGGAKEE